MRGAGEQRIGLAIDDIEDVIMLEPAMVRRPPMADPDETILVGVARHGAEPVAIVDATATFVDDPSGTPTWIQLALRANIGWPAGIGYRIVALTPHDAVR